MLALDLPADLEARLAELATRTGRQPADLVLQALVEQLDEIEDLAIVKQRWREHVESGSAGVVLEEIMRRHDWSN